MCVFMISSRCFHRVVGGCFFKGGSLMGTGDFFFLLFGFGWLGFLWFGLLGGGGHVGLPGDGGKRRCGRLQLRLSRHRIREKRTKRV